jgi:hypothetical protein
MATVSVVTLDTADQAALTLRWLYVDFNSSFASFEQQLRLELRNKPVVVVPVATHESPRRYSHGLVRTR